MYKKNRAEINKRRREHYKNLPQKEKDRLNTRRKELRILKNEKLQREEKKKVNKILETPLKQRFAQYQNKPLVFARQYSTNSKLHKNFMDDNYEPSKLTLKQRFINYQKATIPGIGYDYGNFSFKEKVGLAFVADCHLGSEHTRYVGLHKHFELVRDTKNLYMIMGGDYLDNYNRYSPGGGRFEQIMSPYQASKEFLELVQVARGKILGVVNGCHDNWDFNGNGKTFAREIADSSPGAYWLGLHGFIDIELPGYTYRLFITHKVRGKSYHNTGYGLIKFLGWDTPRGFDIGFSAHFHKPGFIEQTIRGKRRLFINSTSYKITDRFSEALMFPHSPIYSPHVIIHPNKRKIEICDSVEQLVERLEK